MISYLERFWSYDLVELYVSFQSDCQSKIDVTEGGDIYIHTLSVFRIGKAQHVHDTREKGFY
jgi:hypothetical protein